MKASELRIGNLVFVDNERHHPELKDTPMIVQSISRSYRQKEGYVYYCNLDRLIPDISDLIEYSQLIKFLQPIPITEEWVLKLGFNKIVDDMFGLHEYIYEYYSFNIKSGCLENGVLNVNTIPLLYVHQLQNLYFALTGEELTIKTALQ